MRPSLRILVLVVVIAAVGGILAGRRHRESGDDRPTPGARAPLPRLVDLGAGKCIPCKAMAPILEELRRDYTGTFDVVFIDVWEDPGAARPYGINLIPTQIFYDAAGRELGRHEGFLAKDDILARWRDFGVLD